MNLRWLAPEVYESAVVNKSTDVYAFGVTMYECFTQPYSIPYADWKADKASIAIFFSKGTVSLLSCFIHNIIPITRSAETSTKSGLCTQELLKSSVVA